MGIYKVKFLKYFCYFANIMANKNNGHCHTEYKEGADRRVWSGLLFAKVPSVLSMLVNRVYNINFAVN